MPKPRRKSQRRRAKMKEIERPDYLKKVATAKLYADPGLKNYFDQRDATPFNCSLLVKGLADENGGGFIYR